MVPRANPPVADRVASVNVQLCAPANSLDEPHALQNPSALPNLLIRDL